VRGCAMRYGDGLGRQLLSEVVSHPHTRPPAHPRKKRRPQDDVALRSLRASESDLRTMVQVRRVAAQLSATAERELAERSEALNNRLLVLHLPTSPESRNLAYTKW
jgi:hypothetical protein